MRGLLGGALREPLKRQFSRLREKVSRKGATDEGPHPTRLRRATLSRKRERE